MPNTNIPSIANLKRAIEVAEQIEKLQAQLASLFAGGAAMAAAPRVVSPSPTKKRGKRSMSPEARERIAAAQRARWAKSKGAPAGGNKAVAKAPSGRKKRGLSPEGRARIVAALKARWAAKKQGGTASTPANASKTAAAPKAGRKAKRNISPEARAKMAAAARRRWANVKK